VTEQHAAQQGELEWLQQRVAQARRAAVKLVQRVRSAGAAAEERAQLREAACDEHVNALRGETTAMLAQVRDAHATLTGDVQALLASAASTDEQRAMQAQLDRCRTQVAELAVRVDAQGTVQPATDEASHRQLAVDVLEVKSVVARLDGEQRRLAADVEERLRGLMRTAAGGFDVQLALLRGKVEVLARTLRDRVPLDPTAPTADDGLLAHRHGLLERLRDQLGALQTATEWNPRGVLDALLDSTLAAAITPFRRILQLAEGEGASTDAPMDDPTRPTDESTSPS
jgi:hypothetical protein